ncbi:ataxin-10 [Diachasma alloeum]|uniref:ataxin-10 n=1 Tax=Diachasma alloeum TaxID=454923 RepID=UPI0007383B49|nr:ataxin-10 [Diachasma alloeum]
MDNFDRLCRLSSDEKWDEFVKNLDTKTSEKRIIAKLAEILTKPEANLPPNVLFSILKCLANTCVHFKHEAPEQIQNNSTKYLANHCHELYRELSMCSPVDEESLSNAFPYNGIAEWVIDYLDDHTTENGEEQIKIVRTGLRFLCNVSTTTDRGYKAFLSHQNLRIIIGQLLHWNDTNVLLLTCALIHNILFNMTESSPPFEPLSTLEGLIRADTLKVSTANDTIMLFLRQTPDLLDTVYEYLSMEAKLYLTEIIYQNLKDVVYKQNNEGESLPENTIIYLMNRFKKRSDLILKTVDSYLNDMEPAEVTILLDILGVLSSSDRRECHILQRDNSLLINAVFLLRAMHMAGKEENNYFTPVQTLTDIVPNSSRDEDTASDSREDIRNHPAFGFKAGLIRLIGNLVHKHRANQNTLRDTEGISVILDCCNIDGRNPLILQWCIFAIRNACEGMSKNQQIIANSEKIKFIDNDILREMGVTLHEDETGNTVGIVALPKEPEAEKSFNEWD